MSDFAISPTIYYAKTNGRKFVMSKKKQHLLKEATVRRFMGLAKLAPLTSQFMENRYLPEAEAEYDEEDQYGEPGAPMDLEEPEPGMEEQPEPGMEEEPEPGMEEEQPIDQATQSVINDLAQNIAAKISQAFEETPGVEAELSVTAEEEPEMGMEPVASPDGPDMEMPMDDDEEDKPYGEEPEDEDTNDIVNEILRRVARRILKETSK